MPDILIRGMEMPKSCADCHDADLPTAIAFLGAPCPWCHGIIDLGVHDLRHGRHPDCPLHELPEHGDLVDVGTAYDKIAEQETSYYMDMDGVDAGLQATPVIVPASEEG